MNRFETSTLRAYYGQLLTERQNEILRLHYDEDISYGELAEMFSVSRQAVCDAVRRGEEILKNFEDALGLAQKEKSLIAALDTAAIAIGEGAQDVALNAISAAKSILED